MNFEDFYDQQKRFWMQAKIGKKGEDLNSYLILKEKNGRLAFTTIHVDYSPMIAAYKFLQEKQPDYFFFISESWLAESGDYTPNSGRIADLPRDKRREAIAMVGADLTRVNVRKADTFEIVRNADDVITELRVFTWANDPDNTPTMKTRLDDIHGRRMEVE